MNFSIYQGIILAVINILAILIGFMVIKSNPKDNQNRWFLAITILMMLWVNFAFIGSVATNTTVSIIFYRLNWATVAVSLFIFYYFFVGYFINQRGTYAFIDISFPLVSIIIGFLSIFSNLIIDNVIQENWGMEIVFGPLAAPFNVYALIVSFTVVYFGIKYYSQLDKREKQKVRYFFVGISILILANVIFNIIVPTLYNTYAYQYFGDYSIIFFLGFAGYAIVKNRLFDVRFAVIRTVTYVISLSAISFLYFVLAFAISTFIFRESSDTFTRGPADIILVILAAFLLQPIKRFFDRVTNKLFFKDNYGSSDFFSRLNHVITITTSLKELLVGSSEEIAKTIKIEQVFFIVLKQNGRLILAGTDNSSGMKRSDIDDIDEYVISRGSYPIVKGLLVNDSAEIAMAHLLSKHKIEIVVPLLASDQRIGYLCLGDKKISEFNARDVNILESVADELTIAIQNALAVQEIREFNETLQQRIANATRELRTSNTKLRQLDKAKDEFVSMASHQLRTPLTSIKGYISMVIEGDAGKISEQQKQLLDEAFISSERMVHLINDFLNVSRIQTGKFIIEKEPVDLAKIVKQEIDGLQSSAIARNLEYEYKMPKNFPIIKVDEGKIRQVIMNFADNALYYSHENTAIEISLSIIGNNAVYTVTDTGIGVPKSEQEHLFTKFFRASNARVQRPDGTGVGLYMAKRIINGHGGKVIFKSVEGKGSTFGFSLPVE